LIVKPNSAEKSLVWGCVGMRPCFQTLNAALEGYEGWSAKHITPVGHYI